MTPAEELRQAADRLRDSHRYDGIKVDSDSRETLLLLRDLLAIRDHLAAWLEIEALVKHKVLAVPIGVYISARCHCGIVMPLPSGDPLPECARLGSALAVARALNGGAS